MKYQTHILITVFFCILSLSFPVSAKTLNDAKQLIRLKNFTAAHKILDQLATKGDAEAQYFLAVLYRNGHGTEKNLSEAYRWFRASAKKNHLKAQYELGMLYKSGLGTTKNSKKAHYWLSMAASRKHLKAQQQLELINQVDDSSKYSDKEQFQIAVHAIQKNDYEKLTQILQHININNTDSSNNSLLHIASLYKNRRAAQLVLKKGINTDLLNNDGNTALIFLQVKATFL